MIGKFVIRACYLLAGFYLLGNIAHAQTRGNAPGRNVITGRPASAARPQAVFFWPLNRTGIEWVCQTPDLFVGPLDWCVQSNLVPTTGSTETLWTPTASPPQNFTGLNPWGANSTLGASVALNGSTQYVTASPSVAKPVNTFNMCMLVNPTRVNSTLQWILAKTHTGGGASDDVSLYIDANNKYCVAINGTAPVCSATAATEGAWQFLCFTYAYNGIPGIGQIGKIYLNGTLNATSLVMDGPPPANSDRWRIGYDARTSTSFYEGHFSGAFYLNDAAAALSATTISQMYQQVYGARGFVKQTVLNQNVAFATNLSTTRASVAQLDSGAYALGYLANQPRITDKGMLVEGAATNAVLYSRDMTQANWTKTNTTAGLTATGVDGKINGASLITASAGNGTVLQAVTLGSAAYTFSGYVKRVTGTGTVNITIDNGSTWTAITPSYGVYTRFKVTQTLANPTVGFRLVTNGDAVHIDKVQLEAGSGATSPINTTSASATRSGEDIITGSLSYTANPYCMAANIYRPSFGKTWAAYNPIISIGDDCRATNVSSSMYVNASGNLVGCANNNGNSSPKQFTGNTVLAYDRMYRVLFCNNSGSLSLVINGATESGSSSGSSSGSMTGWSQDPPIIGIGNDYFGTSDFDGYISDACISNSANTVLGCQ